MQYHLVAPSPVTDFCLVYCLLLDRKFVQEKGVNHQSISLNLGGNQLKIIELMMPTTVCGCKKVV